jgi:succinyl-CoA:acetate CoA-transferase
MADHSRIRCKALHDKIMTPEEAASLIPPGATVGMSGFTGAGYPKAVPLALAKRIMDAQLSGEKFRISVWTGASTAPELDGALAMVDGLELRLPYQSDPVCRKKINAGEMEYLDIHLSHVAEFVRYGFLGDINVAVIEVVGVTEEGHLIPSTSVGNNVSWVEHADQVILEVNSWQNEKLEGMHDIYQGIALPPQRQPIPLVKPSDRIGSPYIPCSQDKIMAIVETEAPDRNTPLAAPDDASNQIAGHILDFLDHETKRGRLPKNLLPLQSGVGNIANAVLYGLKEGAFDQVTAYTEVIQDGMVDLMKAGKMSIASATAFSLSPETNDELNRNLDQYRSKIIMRPQEISNHPELIRRLGCIAMNAMIEADIYGHVNSTHVMGSRIMNGIGGSGDFARNSFISIFMAPSIAKKGDISRIVPMASHVDHTEHDVQVIVTEQGLADLRGLSPKQRAKQLIERCAHPDYQPLLREYLRKSGELSSAKHSPHLLDESLSWHQRFIETGSMKGDR